MNILYASIAHCARLLPLALAVGSAAADAPIQGDPELLRVVRDAQITAEAQYRRGSLTAEVHDEWGDSLHSRSHITATWENDSVYWEAEYHLETAKNDNWDPFDISQTLKDADKEITDTKVIWIETPRMSCTYFPGRSVATIRYPPNSSHDIPIFQFLPLQVWLTFDRNSDALWSREFDPEWRAAPKQFVVGEGADNNVVVERQFEGGEVLQINVSMRKGALVTSYNYTPRKADARTRRARSHNEGRFEWEQHPSGTWVVREVQQTRRYPEKGDGVFGRYRMKLIDYDPEPEIPANRFDIASLKFSTGTDITELRGVGQNIQSHRYRVGEDAQLPQALLDSLAQELQKQGFAEPKNKEE